MTVMMVVMMVMMMMMITIEMLICLTLYTTRRSFESSQGRVQDMRSPTHSDSILVRIRCVAVAPLRSKLECSSH